MGPVIAHIILEDAGREGQLRFEVPPGRTRIVVGRGEGCTIKLLDSTVAERHLELTLQAERQTWIITPLEEVKFLDLRPVLGPTWLDEPVQYVFRIGSDDSRLAVLMQPAPTHS